MIALYPLLVSNTISKNIIPGVCKSLENYIMVYGLDGLMARIRRERGLSGDFTIRNNKIIRTESKEDELANFLFEEIMQEASGIGSQSGPGNKGGSDEQDAYDYNEKLKDDERTAAAKERGKQSVIKPADLDYEEKLSAAKERGKRSVGPQDANVKLDTFNSQILTLEPTWMKMDQIDSKTGEKISGIIGVKVVPYAVKSDVALSQLLMYDNQVKWLQRRAILMGRTITNFLYKAWMSIWSRVPIFGSKGTTISGDPRKDILLKRTILHTHDAQDIFVLANQSELNQDFYSSASGMKNLQSMGWGSIVIADDVNKRVAFCMKELHGICSMIPYTMLYQSFSQAKVYEDIEDAKRTSSSIFKRNMKPFSKVVGESIAMNMINSYTEDTSLLIDLYENDRSLLDENILDYAKTFTVGKAKAMFTDLASGVTSKVPDISADTILNQASKLNPDFKKGYALANRVIKNSIPNISDKTVAIGSMAVCIRASLSGKDFINQVKLGLKNIIKLFRKVAGDPEDVKLPKEHRFDAIFGWAIIITFTGAIIHYIPLGYKLIDYITSVTKNAWEYIKHVEKEGKLNPQEAIKYAKDTLDETREDALKSVSVESHIGEMILTAVIIAFCWRIIRGSRSKK